ncbi:hypothetical protein [Rheinheimera sp.]|uniref:hypothetical protein n=1 Tax=Rheinheimera sp. TaxID=1869214 RepID=UPI002735D1B6|nr:hypothetical protein [Rheinheimera sp.]MDP2715649.1 hypothetical protein [Rheinheimera sp.]
MTTPERFEQQLQQQYQHNKAKHPLPGAVLNAIAVRAKQRTKPALPGLWRNMQLAMSVCGVLLLGVMLQREPTAQAGYYHIVQIQQQEQQYQEPQYKEMQRHSLSAQAEQGVVSSADRVDGYGMADYFTARAQSDNFHYQTGLLRRQQQDWEISVCDDLLLSIDHNLLAKIAIINLDSTAVNDGQWVEFVSNNKGQLVAISPAKQPLQCRQG